MANRKEPHQAVAEALNAATGSKAVRGEDLLPPDLAKKYRAAKRKRPLRRRSQSRVYNSHNEPTPTPNGEPIAAMNDEEKRWRDELMRTPTQAEAAQQSEESPQRQLQEITPISEDDFGKLIPIERLPVICATCGEAFGKHSAGGGLNCPNGYPWATTRFKPLGLPVTQGCVTIPRQLFEELTSAAIELEENLENICQQPNFGTLKQLSATVEAAVKIRDATATP